MKAASEPLSAPSNGSPCECAILNSLAPATSLSFQSKVLRVSQHGQTSIASHVDSAQKMPALRFQS